jgi:hypothetical protein
MKVKIKDLHPNPYRKIESYPVEEEKVKALMASIKQTGFWDNILARQVDGEIQIAYGHHRLEALKQLMDPEEEVDIPVKDLDDETMLKIMANENVDDWATTPTVIDQTVKAAREFLLSNPEIAQKYGQVHKSSATDENIIGAILIAKFLNWPQQRITDSLERMKMFDNGEASQMTFEWFKTEGSAREFVNVIKKQKKAGKSIPKEKHQEIAKKFKESGNSRKVLEEAVQEVLGDKTQEIESEDNQVALQGSLAAPLNETKEIKSCQEILSEFYDAELKFNNSVHEILSLYENFGKAPEEFRKHQSSVHARLIIARDLIISLIERLVKRPDSYNNYKPKISESSTLITES